MSGRTRAAPPTPEEPAVREILRRLFDRRYVIDVSARHCVEYAADGAALGAWPYEAWLIALARRMYRTDAAAFFSRMDADRLVARLREQGDCPPVRCRLLEQDGAREYLLQPGWSALDPDRLVLLRQELRPEHCTPLGITDELRHGEARFRFLIEHLVENYTEIKVKTGECRMFPASRERMRPQTTLREQIAWWAEHIIVPEEREAYIREYDLEHLVRVLRGRNGRHSAVYTADFAGTRRTLSIISTLYRETTGACDEYIFAYAQDITPLKEQERRNRQLVDISQQLLSLSRTETVTGLYNRAAGETLIAGRLASENSGPAGTMLIIDIDYFKMFNDRHGHQTGDFVLRFFARTLREVFRSTDILCRWGGDEFVVFLPGIHDRKQVESRIERLRCRLRGCDKGGEPLPITVSIGGAVASSGMTVPRVFEVCDRALYQVKERGRDSFLVQGCPGSGF